ncbi:SNF2-related protein [Bradyrhizobium sp. USDA 3256]
MDDFQIDARRWRFLETPDRYIEGETGGLELEPLTRQFKTAREILNRLAAGRGVLLADDVGLGKTTVGALVAWIVASQDKRVRIYAPNEVLRRRWAEELTRHVPLLKRLGGTYDGIRSNHIRQGEVERLRDGSIQVATHHALVKSHGNNEQRTACDLMIIDEAHRAKGDGSAFNDALRNLGDRAKRKLILTATPFSIRLAELEQLLQFVGASELGAVSQYAKDLKQLYSLGDGHDVAAEAGRLESAARVAIEALQPYLIRHGIDDLSPAERKYFGNVEKERWDIATPPASPEDIELLLRMDRLLQLAPERKGERRNDPRFHIGWRHVDTELDRAAKRSNLNDDPVFAQHIKKAKRSLSVRDKTPHPKIAAVTQAIYPLLGSGEKVLIFCHHRAAAGELLTELEKLPKADKPAGGPGEAVWREAWESLLTAENIWPEEEKRPHGYDELMKPIIDWLCTTGVRRQIAGWLDKPAVRAEALANQLSKAKPRNAARGVPTIVEAATTLVNVLLDEQSTSTRAVLKSIAKGTRSFGGQVSHFPGRLDEGLRVMGSWDHDSERKPPKTLYTGKPDIVLALFNSPFGPDVLVTTDRLSEGVDLHRFCRHVIHYELDPSPVRTIQRNGRVRRVGSWAALTGLPICYAYPTFGGTRDEKAVGIMRQRIQAFGLLLGGVPPLDDELSDSGESFAGKVLGRARKNLEKLNRALGVAGGQQAVDGDDGFGRRGGQRRLEPSDLRGDRPDGEG